VPARARPGAPLVVSRTMRRALCLPLLFFFACSSNETTAPTSKPDAGAPVEESDSGNPTPKDASADTVVDTGPTVDPDAGAGETCIGYGDGDSGKNEQGKPYGYVCFGGAPPGVTGCKLLSSSSLGNSYCCSENVCVEQIDQSAACNAVSGKPRRFQCPPTASGNATPPPNCVEHNSGSTEVEKYYCCP